MSSSSHPSDDDDEASYRPTQQQGTGQDTQLSDVVLPRRRSLVVPIQSSPPGSQHNSEGSDQIMQTIERGSDDVEMQSRGTSSSEEIIVVQPPNRPRRQAVYGRVSNRNTPNATIQYH